LDRLHDSLESYDVAVQVEVLNNSVARCPSIEHFRFPDGWVSTRAVEGRCSSRTHHADTMSLSGSIPGDDAPNLRVFFDGVLIGGCS
jgi:hypothetical protein